MFPPVAQDSFEWWSPTQRRQLATYSWDVLVKSRADTTYAITAWLPAVGFDSYARWYAKTRPIPPGTQRGNLAALVAARLPMVELLEGHMGIAIPRMHVTARTGGRSVVLELNEPRTIRRVFAARPSHVRFYEYDPDGRPRVASIAVMYVDQ